jgi:flagellar basal body-associated protein FliL
LAQVIHDADGDHTKIEATEARQGGKGKQILLVLMVSTILAAIVLFVSWGFRSDDLAEANQTQTPPPVVQPQDGSTPAPAAVAPR